MVSDKTARLLQDARNELDGVDPDSDEARTVSVIQQDYDQATRLPAEFVAEFTRETALAHEVWAEARQKSDFKLFQPKLEKIMELARAGSRVYWL